ncbi:uncharacterized mitochondrial protein AtMg00810-like [Jatropha curcas]|uniref:uncharacterized mitochondrial protein AtMg00810-like n=1 Tax=Jatropha curcas TaxID=180498 RepID=UPI0018931A56|nr:uncharacterized mitochondrial protein AtMg00810-like [Jatropha curcas]
MAAELQALTCTKTWKLVDLPVGKIPTGCKWVYKIKHRSDGSIERNKARLVAKRYTQVISKIDLVKQNLDSLFKIKYLGPLKFFLGLEIVRSQRGISLCQWKYALELLSNTSYLTAKPTSTPMDSHHKFNSHSGSPLPDSIVYRRLVAKLLYLTTTRPDITFSANHLCQFLSKPTTVHLQAHHRILRYIKSAPGKGLFFPTSSCTLKAFSDSDWAGCVDTRRSISSFSVYLGNSLISWKSKKQQTVSRSSSEAEYRALAAVTCEVQQLKYMLTELSIPHPQPIIIYCDNQLAIHIAANPTFHERTKHIELDCHIVREKVNSGFIHLLPISSSTN